MPEKGPNLDRVLMRLKDVIIIGTAAFAILKWLYINPLQVQDRISQQEVMLKSILEKVEKLEIMAERHRSR